MLPDGRIQPLTRTAWPGTVTSLLVAALVCGCSNESRTVGPTVPQTPPTGSRDPRISLYENNLYQVSQGGRYFSWYGCAACHGTDASGARDLPSRLRASPRAFTQVYRDIVGHPGTGVDYSRQIPVEQTWQLSAYVRSLLAMKTEMRRRQDFDQAGEPQGQLWSGPVK